MSYRVKNKEKVSDAIRRIAGEEINSIIVQIRSVPLHSETIHEARRHLKKLRALLRFVRRQLPSASFQREKQMLRAAARILAPARDAHVLMKTLAGLGKISADNTEQAFRHLRTALQKEGERCVPGKAKLNTMEMSLRAVLGRLEKWPLAKCGTRTAQESLARSFRRCQKAFRQSLTTSDRRSFHAWRKRIKDLEYHLCLFERAWRKKTARVWKQIKRLDDYLGED